MYSVISSRFYFVPSIVCEAVTLGSVNSRVSDYCEIEAEDSEFVDILYNRNEEQHFPR